MGVKTIFLHGNLDEQIYMEQPKESSHTGHGRLVYKLKRYYGLKESPKKWYQIPSLLGEEQKWIKGSDVGEIVGSQV